MLWFICLFDLETTATRPLTLCKGHSVWYHHFLSLLSVFGMIDLTCWWFLQPLNCGLCLIPQHWTSMESTGWTNRTTLNSFAGVYIYSKCIHPCIGPYRTYIVYICSSLFFDLAEVASTWGGRPLRQALTSPWVTAVDRDSSAQYCRSPMQLSMKPGSIDALTNTWKLTMAKLQPLFMCLFTV